MPVTSASGERRRSASPSLKAKNHPHTLCYSALRIFTQQVYFYIIVTERSGRNCSFDQKGAYGTELGQRSAPSSCSWHGLESTAQLERSQTAENATLRFDWKHMRKQDFQKPFASLAALLRSRLPFILKLPQAACKPRIFHFSRKYQKGMGGEEEASWLSSLIDQADNLILTIGGYDIDIAGEKRYSD